MNAFTKRAEVAANICIILVTVLIVTGFVDRYISLHNQPHPIKVGEKLKVETTGADHTLVMILQKGCKFCKASGPFYVEMLNSLHSDPGIHVEAVLPQTTSDSKEFLTAELGVSISDVRQSSLSSLGILGTPTLVLLDKTGNVTDLWAGQLSPDDQQKVTATLDRYRTIKAN